MNNELKKDRVIEEIPAKASSGMVVLLVNTVLMIASIVGIVFCIIDLAGKYDDVTEKFGDSTALPVLGIVVCSVYLLIVGLIIYGGLHIIKPNEAVVLTLFGKYYGTLKGEGFYWTNPFCSAFNPASEKNALLTAAVAASAAAGQTQTTTSGQMNQSVTGKKISLKSITLNNDKQKINDALGNPISIGIVVIWRVVNTAKAVFNVDNYVEFLSIQSDAALRNTVRLYPYDIADESDDDKAEKSLRGSSQEIAESIRQEIQEKVEFAGIEIIEARITHLAYASEIAAVMLQRQQASAIIDARRLIVDGAVGMVEMALSKLSENNVVHLDEERKAAMVSNLLVVLCGDKGAQPIVNSGSLY
jgi:regulator of protease activity HflC (stomatin/prohibitin superfamily)